MSEWLIFSCHNLDCCCASILRGEWLYTVFGKREQNVFLLLRGGKRLYSFVANLLIKLCTKFNQYRSSFIKDITKKQFDLLSLTLTLTRWSSYTNLIRIPWRCTRRSKMNFRCQGFRQLSYYRRTDGTDATEYITTLRRRGGRRAKMNREAGAPLAVWRSG